ncbi:hypothetical protein FRC08_003296 [Ceratobasidium sp. 394]|nr:hypothetical protein FRC08_003296 [Ceratobasidium sp. 394]KAG9091430.1 hypothetical protein FS749_016548 [Ceratobasidium sp. UAMH 11750]
MPSYAGFFASHNECQAWLTQYAPDIIEKQPSASVGAVRRKAEEFMKRRGIRQVFFFKPVPWPVLPEPGETRFGLMLIRRWSEHKEYFAPDPVHDLPLRESVEMEFGLKVSDWAVVWYSDEDPNLISEFVLPNTS